MDKTIYLIRHGQTEYNRLGIVQGSGVDTSLNETGKAQAIAFYERYKEIPFELVVSSALKRTQETIHPFIEQGLTWKKYKEINEMSWGDHEGKHRTPEMIAAYKLITDEWDRGNFDAKLERGESPNEVAARCKVFVEQLKGRKEEKILICGHGRLNRCLLCVLLDQDLTYMQTYEHKNTGLYIIKYKDGQPELLTNNDLSHLEEVVALQTDRF